MSEQLLRVIIHLLAIVAKEDDVTEDERIAIQDFLLDNSFFDSKLATVFLSFLSVDFGFE